MGLVGGIVTVSRLAGHICMLVVGLLSGSDEASRFKSMG